MGLLTKTSPAPFLWLAIREGGSVTNEGSALGKEDTLNLAFANKLVESAEFVRWLLARTKFREFAEHARLLHEEQARARTARFWWRHWWCNIPELAGDSETDIFLAFEAEGSKERFCLHVENKISSSTFTPNQERSYAIRGQYMLDHTKSAQLRCTDFDTVLIAPGTFRKRYRDQCNYFGQFICHDEIGAFVPEFRDPSVSPSGTPP